MAQWAVEIPAERYETERLFHHETVVIDPADVDPLPDPGDEVVVVVAGEKPIAVAVGRVVPPGRDTGAQPAGPVTVAYTRRSFDDPVPADALPLNGSVSPVGAEAFRQVVGQFAATRERRTWLVSLDLPIEAETPAEAVRQFWSYALQLGPQELPTFVSPSHDELAMQAFVLGAETNLDPEEDDDEQ